MQAREDYPAALSDFDRNLEIAQDVGLKPNIANALANRANVLWRLGRYDEAKQSLLESQQLAETAELEGELLARLSLISAEMDLSAGRFRIAETEARLALQRAGEQFEAVAIQAHSIVGLAQALSGNSRGVKMCSEAVELARHLGTSPLISTALLTLATAELAAGDAQNALTNALQVRETFRASGQQESEWRALSIAALASTRAGHIASARPYGSDATKVLADFGRRFDVNAYQLYLNRRDVQRNKRQLLNEVAAK
jgi:tetratricopeptide (TPR) repeat protein